MSGTTNPEAGQRRGVRRRLLSDRRFVCVFVARLGSSMANGLLPVALSFGVLRHTGSAKDLGLVLAVQGAVSLALSLFAGVAADRLPRTTLLVSSSAVRLVAAGALAAVMLTGHVSLLWFFVVAVIYGSADALFAPTSTALLPEIVRKEDLGEANGLIGGFSALAFTVAPALAGVVVAASGPAAAFLLEAALMAVVTGSLAVAGLANATTPAPAGEGGILAQMRLGWNEFRSRRWLWLLTLQWSLFSMILVAPMSVLGPAVADAHLGGAAVWGVIGTCMTVGMVGAQFLAGRIRPRRPVFFIACLPPIIAIEALALGLGASAPVVAVAALFTGCALGLQGVFFQTVMQQGIPGEVLGRVAAFDLVVSEVGQPVGYALAGPAGEVFGPRQVLAACALIGSAGALLFTATLRRAGRPGEDEPMTPPVRGTEESTA